MKNLALKADASLLLVAVVWGSGFTATQYAIDSQMSTSLIMTIRFSIAALLLGALFFKRIIKISRRDLIQGFLGGGLLFLAFFSQTKGLVFTSPSNNAFITATNVIMVPFITWVLLKKRPPLKTFLLTFSCLLGIALLSYSLESGFHFSLGDSLTLLCAFLFAAHISYLDIAAKAMDYRTLAFLQMAAAALLSWLVLLLGKGNSFSGVDFSLGLLPVIYLGVFSTCLCFLMQTAAQKQTTAAKTAIILSTEGLWGSTFAILLGLDSLSINLVGGGILILGSVILSETNFQKKPVPSQQTEENP